MKNDFIYDVMRSEEIREYYRKNVELDTEEQESVIIKSYNSLKNKLELLKKLYNNIPEQDKKDIEEMITLYELMITIYYNPYEFFGKECRVLYALHSLKPLCNLLGNEIAIEKHRLDYYYSQYVEYFDNIESMNEFLFIEDNLTEPFEVDIIVIPNNGVPSYFPIDFHCEYLNKELVPLSFIIDNKITLFDKFNISEAISRNRFSRIGHRGLPFESGCRIKIQTPIMQEPFYCIIKSEQDYPIDPNSCWYNFAYKDGTKKDEFDNSDILLDLSYLSNIGVTSEYAVFDWVERA